MRPMRPFLPWFFSKITNTLAPTLYGKDHTKCIYHTYIIKRAYWGCQSSGNFFHPLARVYGMLGRFECVNSSHMGFRCLIIWSLCNSMNRSITLYSCLTLYPNSFFLLVTSSSKFSLFYEWFAGISTLSTYSLLLQFMFTWLYLS